MISVAIAGAGLSGLCLAQGLTRAGIDAHVYEREPSAQTRRQGFRITLDQYGANALKQCLPPALYEMVLATASVPEGVGYFRFTNAQLGEIFTLTFKQEVDPAKQQVIGQVDRATLRTLLMAGLEDRVHFGKAATYVENITDGTRLHFADGTHVDASIVVGSDGINSPIRKQILPDCAPIDTGYRGIYGKTLLMQNGKSLIPEGLENSGVFALGKPEHGFFYTAMRFKQSSQGVLARLPEAQRPAIGEDYVMWAILAPQQRLPSDLWNLDAPALHQLALSEARDYHPVLRRFVEGADPDYTLAVALNAAQRPQDWAASRVTLMGDAVHVMPPLGAHGGNTALRDAALLTEKLSKAISKHQAIEVAIGEYQAEMVAYSFKEVETAKRMLRQSTTRNPVIRLAMTRAIPWVRSVMHPAPLLEAS